MVCWLILYKSGIAFLLHYKLKKGLKSWHSYVILIQYTFNLRKNMETRIKSWVISNMFFKALYVCVLVAQLCLTLCDPTDCSPPGFSVHRILQARILEWIVNSFSRGSSWPRDWTQVSHIAGRVFTIWATREALKALFGLDVYSCNPKVRKQKRKSSANCCCSVMKLCLILCNRMNSNTAGFPVLHCLPELAQTHVHESVMSSNHLILCRPLLCS